MSLNLIYIPPNDSLPPSDIDLSDGKILIGDATNQAAEQSVSGAITITRTGVSTLSSGIDAAKIADGTVSNTEFQYINSVTSNVQTQLDAKLVKASNLSDVTDVSTSRTNLGLGTADSPTFANPVFTSMFIGSPSRQFGYKEITLTNAQVLALNGTPQTIVDAPGANKVIIPLMAFYSVTIAALGAYATNTQLFIQTAGATSAGNGMRDTNTLPSTATRIVLAQYAPVLTAVSAVAFVANQPLQAIVNTGNPTGGNAGNSLTIGVFYVITAA